MTPIQPGILLVVLESSVCKDRGMQKGEPVFSQGQAQRVPPSERQPIPVLVVSETEADHTVLCQILVRWWRPERARSCGEAAKWLHRNEAAVVICERTLPDGDWKVVLDLLNTMPAPPSLIVTSRLPDEAFWAEVLNLGAWDVLGKPFVTEEVVRVVHGAWFSWKARRDRARTPEGRLPKSTAGQDQEQRRPRARRRSSEAGTARPGFHGSA